MNLTIPTNELCCYLNNSESLLVSKFLQVYDPINDTEKLQISKIDKDHTYRTREIGFNENLYKESFFRLEKGVIVFISSEDALIPRDKISKNFKIPPSQTLISRLTSFLN